MTGWGSFSISLRFSRIPPHKSNPQQILLLTLATLYLLEIWLITEAFQIWRKTEKGAHNLKS